MGSKGGFHQFAPTWVSVDRVEVPGQYELPKGALNAVADILDDELFSVVRVHRGTPLCRALPCSSHKQWLMIRTLVGQTSWIRWPLLPSSHLHIHLSPELWMPSRKGPEWQHLRRHSGRTRDQLLKNGKSTLTKEQTCSSRSSLTSSCS